MKSIPCPCQPTRLALVFRFQSCVAPGSNFIGSICCEQKTKLCNKWNEWRLEFDECSPDRERSVESDEGVREVVLVGHVAAVTQVEVIALSTLPAHTVQSVHSTHVARDAQVTHTST